MLTERQKIAHLYRRAGFGAAPGELEAAIGAGYAQTLDSLLEFEKYPDTIPSVTLSLAEEPGKQRFQFHVGLGQTGEQTMTDLPVLPREELRFMSKDERRMHFKQEFQQVMTNIVRWLNRMAVTPRPFQEKMAFFWHGHFATSVQKVRDATLMEQQINLFRRYGLGDFEALVQQVSKDPAMILWLDTQTNVRRHPNENYARELMELFTMGIGSYTENDVRQGARCFTGWKTEAGEFMFNPRQHDFGAKEFIGRTGDMNGEDVVRIVSRSPAAARFISGKIFSFFVHDNPDPATVEWLAKEFRGVDFQIKPLMKIIFQSPAFLSARAYRAKVKSPVELVASAIRLLGGSISDANTLNLLNRMGQMLYAPPSVKGWAGGPAWINTATMFDRFNFATFLVYAKQGPLHGGQKLVESARDAGAESADELVAHFSDIMLQDMLPEKSRSAIAEYAGRFRARPRRVREVARLILCSPEFQMA